MKLLLDECIPKSLKSSLTGLKAFTVYEMGWSGKKNGELLRAALAENFTAFLTLDQNLQYQQNLKKAPLLILLIHSKETHLEALKKFTPKIIQTLKSGKTEPNVINLHA